MISYSQSKNIKLYFEVLICDSIEWMIFWMKYLWFWMTLLNLEIWGITKSVICQFRETESKIYQQQSMS